MITIEERRRRNREYMRNQPASKMRERSRLWAKNHPERRREITLKSSRKNAERYKATHKAWAVKNRERLSKYHLGWSRRHGVRPMVHSTQEEKRERIRLYRKAYYHRTKHNGKHKSYIMARRARLLDAKVENCIAKIKALKFERFCRWCCIGLTRDNFSIDHVIPITRGGKHCPDNLVAACLPCNHSKSNKLVHEWKWSLAA